MVVVWMGVAALGMAMEKEEMVVSMGAVVVEMVMDKEVVAMISLVRMVFEFVFACLWLGSIHGIIHAMLW